MDETIANNARPKPEVKCDECDTVRDHYVTFVLPDNEIKHVCWSCQEREDKAFNTKPEWKRSPRQPEIKKVAEK
ncbi:MAG TPA: hypothetical protein VNI84_06900 [Pyrinomonadaceae bacterium]|nr:hypothetical protein [Pyrinomonadaceae bacterium]